MDAMPRRVGVRRTIYRINNGAYCAALISWSLSTAVETRQTQHLRFKGFIPLAWCGCSLSLRNPE